eukprot:403331997
MYEPQQLSQQKSYMNQKASHDQDFVSNSSYQYSTRLNNHVHQNFNYTPQNFKQVQFQQEKAQKQQKAQPQKLQNQLFDVPQITKNQKQRSPKKAQAGLQQEVTDGLNQMQYLQTPSSLMSNLPSIKSQKPNSLKKFEGDQPNLNQSNNHFSNKDQIMLEHSQQEFNNPSQSPKRRGRSPSPRKLQNQPSHDQETQNKQAPSKKTRTSKSAGQMPTLLTRFELGRILSSGMIGIVYVARDRFYANQTWSSLYCIKRMYKSKIVEKHLMTSTVKEIEILLKVRKIKGCIQLIELINSKDSIDLIFTYYQHGDLYKYFKNVCKFKMPESLVQHIVKQLVNTMIEIHKLRIVHRDMKPENILIRERDMSVFITDFGFALQDNDNEFKRYQRVGTLEFYPIEMLSPCDLGSQKHQKRVQYDHRVDIWCIGIIAYELLYCRTPFYSGDSEDQDAETKRRIRALEYTFPNRNYPVAEDFFKRILTLPNQRATLNELKNHKWLKNAPPYLPSDVKVKQEDCSNQNQRQKGVKEEFKGQAPDKLRSLKGMEVKVPQMKKEY